MIITTSKPFSEILSNIKSYKRIFVVGCAACAAKCQTGGEEQVKNMIEELKKENKEVTGFIVLDTPCDMRIVKKDLAKLPEVKRSEALLVLACGGGVQAIEKIVDKPLLPALDPVFVGSIERIGVYNEFCSICGQCIIDSTGGICPVARCAKSLMNGPCGGAVNGKCEVDPELDCAWVLIYNKLNKINKKENIFKVFMEPRKHSKPKKLDNSRKL
ncbi:MAG: methylenetetrahydrofolate reductase C-terminal domain-containing protein [Elusimicrobia bacterium]|nr:methylenetetrahydrofolate reductase C-terminal domain-containing protein [Candidatus Liberimonas magnetica]